MNLNEFLSHSFETAVLPKVNYISHTIWALFSVILVLKFVQFCIKSIPSVFVRKLTSSNNSPSVLPPNLSLTTAVDAELIPDITSFHKMYLNALDILVYVITSRHKIYL